MKTVSIKKISTTTIVSIAVSIAIAGSLAGLSACSSEAASPKALTLVAYDSFTPPEGAFDAFTADTGITVDIALSGDTGEMVAKAALTSGNPEGDVMWGVDNTLISRANESDVFDGTPVEVDFGDVCVNYDIAALEQLGLDAPVSLEDLASPDYRSLLVVENASTSSPGLAFLLATVAAFDEGWPDYWQRLVDNDVLVVDSWDDAYYTAFTRYGGDRPLVVSYSTSPPAEVIFADPPLPTGAPAPTGVAVETCFRQTEYAGVLRGTKYPSQARQLVEYLAGPEFQKMLPESLFVYPANRTVALPDSFVQFAPTIDNSWTISPEDIAANRQAWTEKWMSIVLS